MVSPSGLILLLGIAGLSAAAPSPRSHGHEKSTKCFKGPFMLVAHGTGETGEGALGQITSAFQAQDRTAGSFGFEYPSTMTNYTWSESTGIHHLKNHIKEYVHKCGHNAKIMLLGYSQGANIVSDVLSGGSFAGSRGKYGFSIPLVEKYSKHIVGVLLYGDPSFVANEPWDRGTSTHDGLVGKTPEQLQNLARYRHMMRSYCDKNDPYCASGTKTNAHLEIHGEYFQKYDTEVVEWLQRLWNREK